MGDRFGAYLGSVQANDDPEQRGRVKVLVPDINAREVLPFWAFARGQCLGGAPIPGSRVPGARTRKPARGRFVVPDVGAQVIVTFLNGNPELPMWEPGPPVVADVPPGVKSSRTATRDRYPSVSQLLRGRSVEVIEHEAGDLDVVMDGAREVRIDTKGAKLSVRTLPDNPVVINDGTTSNKAARTGDRVEMGSLAITIGGGGVASVVWTPPEGGAPVTLSVVPTAIHGLISTGSALLLVGGESSA